MSQKKDDAPEQYTAYLSVRLGDKKDESRAIQMASKLSDAESFDTYDEKQEELFDASRSDADLEYKEDPESPLTPVAQLCEDQMEKSYYSLSPYHELVMISNFIRPILSNSILDNEIVRLAKEKGQLFLKTDRTETYGLDTHLANQVSQIVARMRQTDRGLALLPASSLLSLVATFDSMIGDGVKALLKIRPEKITSSDKMVSYKDLFSLGDLEEAKSRFINEEVDKLLRGSHDEQVQYIEKMISTDIRKKYTRWPNFIEIFERRNIFAHANGIYTNIYADKCASAGYRLEGKEIGKLAKLSLGYLHKSIDILTEFSVLLWFVSWRKLDVTSEKSAYARLNMIAFEAIKAGRCELATWLLDFALFKQPRNADDMTTRMMVINLANSYKKRNKGDKCKEVLNEMDWSATSDLFALALASLNEEKDTASKLLLHLAKSGKLRSQDFREWPIFDWIRNDSAVATAFEEGFGEPLLINIDEAGAISPSPDENPAVDPSSVEGAESEESAAQDDEPQTMH